METRQLGGSGLRVPVLTFGTGTFGGQTRFSGPGERWIPPPRHASSTSPSTPDSTMFDTADIYSTGESERVLGQAIKGRRDQVLISTKGTFRTGPGPNDVGSSRHHLLEAFDASLRRLGTDYIDLYQLHGFDALTPVEEIARHARHPGPGGQDPLHRLLELLGLASDEVARRVGALWLGPLCRPPGLLLAGRPRL